MHYWDIFDMSNIIPSEVIIFGGAGFIGSNYAKYFIQNNFFSRIHLFDIELKRRSIRLFGLA